MIAAIAVLLVAWGAWAWGIRDNVFPRNFGEVQEGRIYRSAALTPAAMAKVHDQYHIKTIVDLGAFDKDPVGERVAERTAAALGMERFEFPLEGDGTGDPNAYVRALHVMADPSKQPVLVHCATGSQRTGACVLLYEEIVQGRSGPELQSELRQHGHDPERNPRLAPYLHQWTDAIRGSFRSGKPIATDHPSQPPAGADAGVMPAGAGGQ